MKKTLKLTSFLLVIGLVAGIVLAGMNQLTAERINAQKLKAEIENLDKIFPGATFEEIEVTNDNSKLIDKIFIAKDKGYVYKASAQGFSDVLTIMLGFSDAGKIVGFEVVYFNDTPGIGDAVTETTFKDRIVGINSNDKVATISGATVSSTAVIKALDAAKAHFNALKGITGEGKEPLPEVPTVQLNDEKLKFNDPILDNYEGEVFAKTDDGNVRTYHIKVNGYGLVDNDGSHGGTYSQNEYEIKVDLAEKKVISIVYLHFGDTPGFGDRTVNEAYYELFEGISTLDYEQEINTATKATRTSRSMIKAVKIVMDDLGK